jgi:hypothetical protein
MLIIQRNSVIGENQKATPPPATVANAIEHSRSLECAQGRLFESLQHQLELVTTALRTATGEVLGEPGLLNLSNEKIVAANVFPV